MSEQVSRDWWLCTCSHWHQGKPRQAGALTGAGLVMHAPTRPSQDAAGDAGRGDVSMFYDRDTTEPIEPRDAVHYQVHLAHSGLGGWTWACFCRATGSAPSREEADRAFVRHTENLAGAGGETPVTGERTVTTRDGFVTEFNAQSDGEAKAYKAGWADCLAEIGDEDSLIAARVASAAAERDQAVAVADSMADSMQHFADVAEVCERKSNEYAAENAALRAGVEALAVEFAETHGATEAYCADRLRAVLAAAHDEGSERRT